MNGFIEISGEASRKVASALFPNTSRGRSISRMLADGLGTSVDGAHILMLLGAVVICSIVVTSKK